MIKMDQDDTNATVAANLMTCVMIKKKVLEKCCFCVQKDPHSFSHDHPTWFWKCVGTAFGHFSFGFSQSHGHNSWLMCEVAMSLSSQYMNTQYIKIQKLFNRSEYNMCHWNVVNEGCVIDANKTKQNLLSFPFLLLLPPVNETKGMEFY